MYLQMMNFWREFHRNFVLYVNIEQRPESSWEHLKHLHPSFKNGAFQSLKSHQTQSLTSKIPKFYFRPGPFISQTLFSRRHQPRLAQLSSLMTWVFSPTIFSRGTGRSWGKSRRKKLSCWQFQHLFKQLLRHSCGRSFGEIQRNLLRH